MMPEFTRFDKHEDFYQYLDEIIAQFKLDVAKNHPDLSKCEIHVNLRVMEFHQSQLGKNTVARFHSSINRLN